ncbi:aminoglycoside 6-adenylyltransferase [Paenibacillus solisilvae]|uniref:Aminoglycoside 6-adenylyltransferase n=1 Tax=Paenibacillus solisilvae TaxID=2486751 RepID=A0ABW0W9Q0_9BACL
MRLIVELTEEDERIRAVIMNGSRGNPDKQEAAREEEDD